MTRQEMLELLGQQFFTIRWDHDAVEMIDQRLLPGREVYIRLPDPEAVAGAIREMVIRGAPAIGIAGAMGVALAALEASRRGRADAERHVTAAARMLAQVRPTAVNLGWGVERALEAWRAGEGQDPAARARAVASRAEELLREDVEICRAIGRHGASLLPDPVTILTHCNAGALATGGYGTALGVVRAAREAGKKVRVLADETRPFLQGARLTAWELARDGFDVTVIPDSNAATFLRRGEVDAVVVGADRIARNGDAANKVGTYPLAVLAAEHAVPFHVAAPVSTVDLDTPSGDDIPIEDRPSAEVTHVGETCIVPEGVSVANVAFDVTPHRLIRSIVTERGAFAPADLAAGISSPG
jgi:methylthioribose-1-phosphate isomerase